ncbi:efflux RND transporter permease subunit [PVC group bacterium]|nr:efflux RND transporter permease subunit [PVC group bacterium]
MGLPSFSVRRPITILMIYLGMVVLGVVSLTKLPVELMPNVSFRKITIYVGVRGGLPPTEVESLVTRPIEEAVGTIQHLKSIRSVSRKERSEVILEFEPGTNMDFASLEVREKFARVKHKLPEDIERPVIANYEETDVPVISLSVKSDKMPLNELKNLIDAEVKENLSRIEGVANVKTYGGGSEQRKVFIEVSLKKLQVFGLGINEVTDAIGKNNKSFAIGDIEKDEHRYMIRAIGQYKNLEEIGNTIIKTSRDDFVGVRIKDIANISDSSLEPESLSRINGESVVSIHVQRESTANTISVVEGVQNVLETFRSEYASKGIFIEENSNQADFIKKAILSVQKSLMFGGVLSLIILFLFLRDIRMTLAVTISIPISVIITFACMYFQNLTINVMTLSGLALGIGMLIDNSIVVLENIHKMFVRTGDRVRASILGSEEMILAIIASTLTTVVVFLPLIFVSKEIKLLYFGLSMTVTYSLFASLFVAITLIPSYTSIVMRKQKDAATLASKMKPAREWFVSIAKFPVRRIKEIFQTRFLSWLGMAVRATADALKWVVQKIRKFKGRISLYGKLIVSALRYRYLVVAVALLLFVVSLGMFKNLDRTLMGATDEGQFTIFAELDSGAKLDISNLMVKEIEKILDDIPEIKNYSSDVEPTSSQVHITLFPAEEREKSTQQIIDELRLSTDDIETNYRGGFIYYSEQQSTGGGKEVQLDIYGHNYDVLKEIAISIASRMGTVQGIEDPKMARLQGRPELRFYVDKIKAAYMGFTTGDIANAIHGQLRGFRASTLSSEFFDIGGSEVEIVTRLQPEDRDTFDAIGQLSLTQYLDDGVRKQTFLRQLVEYSFDIGPSEIFRKNKHRMFHVSANIGDNPLGRIVEDIKESLKDLKLPKEYYYEFGEEYKRMQKNQRELTIAAILTLLLVYMLLASIFESYYQPLIIMSSVVLALMGAIVALYLLKLPISMGVMIGTIMLFGIVVNNGIVMVDHINHLRAQKGARLYPSVIHGSLDRFRPVMMTSLTTILGMLPMALDRASGAVLWSPLAITVIGGMVSATCLTLVIVPCIYVIFEDIGQGFLKARTRLKEAVVHRKYWLET